MLGYRSRLDLSHIQPVEHYVRKYSVKAPRPVVYLKAYTDLGGFSHKRPP